jgi:hypothetical protein
LLLEANKTAKVIRKAQQPTAEVRVRNHRKPDNPDAQFTKLLKSRPVGTSQLNQRCGPSRAAK